MHSVASIILKDIKGFKKYTTLILMTDFKHSVGYNCL